MTEENKINSPERSPFKLNSPVVTPWSEAIGKLIINFGAIEALSYFWIKELSKDELLSEISFDTPLGRRIDIICKLVQRLELDKKTKNKIKSQWKRIKKISELRNEIAHNPLVFGWNNPEENGPPDFIGHPNLKKIKSKRKPIIPLSNLKDINHSINELATLNQELEKRINSLKAG